MKLKLKVPNKKLKAFGMLDLLAYMAIFGIMILLVLPNHSKTISKFKAMEARNQLDYVYSLQKEYFYENSKYCPSLEELGFEQEKLSTEGGKANYMIEIVDAGPSSFKISATAVVDFDQNGVFNKWEIDHEKNLKEVTKD